MMGAITDHISQAATFLPVALQVLVFLAFLGAVPLIILVGRVSSRSWRRWAVLFPCSKKPPGQSYRVPVAIFSGTRYLNSVRIVPTNSGLFFQVPLWIRASHPSFEVPWTKVRKLETKAGVLAARHELRIEEFPEEMLLRITDEAKRDVLRYHQPIS